MDKINLTDPPGMNAFQLREHYANMFAEAKKDLAQKKQRNQDQRLTLTRLRLQNQIARRQNLRRCASAATQVELSNSAIAEVAGAQKEVIKKFDRLTVAEQEADRKSVNAQREIQVLPEKYGEGGLARMKARATQKNVASKKKQRDVVDRFEEVKLERAEVEKELERTKQFFRDGITETAQQISDVKMKIIQKKLDQKMNEGPGPSQQ